MTIGQKIRKLRIEAGEDQQTTAGIMMVSRASLSIWEHDYGIPNDMNLARIAKHFGVTVEYLTNPDMTEAERKVKKVTDQVERKTSDVIVHEMEDLMLTQMIAIQHESRYPTEDGKLERLIQAGETMTHMASALSLMCATRTLGQMPPPNPF